MSQHIGIMYLAAYFLLQTATPVYAQCNPSLGNCPAGLQELEDVFKQFISVAVGLGFLVMLIMLVWAGIKYLTSGGEQKEVQQAHYTMTWALLGILFFAIAWLLLLLIQTFTGIEVTTFNIKALCKIAGSTTDFCSPK